MDANSGTFIGYNPHYRLCIKEIEKGFAIFRLADNARLATIIIRDKTQVIAFQWDFLTGKFLILFYRDGSARIFNCFMGGKLISLLRVTNERIIAGCWDRVPPFIHEAGKSSHDITKLMPLMIKFGRDSKQTYILPYDPPNSAWRRQITDEGVEEENGDEDDEHACLLDIHVAYQEKNGSFTIMFDGDCAMTIARDLSDNHLNTSPPVQKILIIEHGFYCVFHRDGSFESLNSRPLLECELTTSLIDHIISMRQLSRYLHEHLEIIEKDLVSPYIEFLFKLCGQEYNIERLREQLSSLLLIGDIPFELEDWFVNKVGEKNLKKWRKLGSEAHQMTLQVLTLAFIPACDRLIILSERIGGFLKSLQLMEKQMIVELLDLSKLITTLQSLLGTTLETIKEVSHQDSLFKVYLDWFNDRVMESIDEDFKPKMNIDDKPDIASNLLLFFESKLKKQNHEEAMNNFTNINSFKELLKQLDQNLDLVLNKHVKPKVLQKLTRGYYPSPFRVPTLKNSSADEIQILDVITSTCFPFLVYVASKGSSISNYCVGTLEKKMPCKTASKEVYFQIPPTVERQSKYNAQLCEIYDLEDDKECSKNVTMSVRIQLACEASSAKETAVNISRQHNATAVERETPALCYTCLVEPNGELKISQQLECI